MFMITPLIEELNRLRAELTEKDKQLKEQTNRVTVAIQTGIKLLKKEQQAIDDGDVVLRCELHKTLDPEVTQKTIETPGYSPPDWTWICNQIGRNVSIARACKQLKDLI